MCRQGRHGGSKQDDDVDADDRANRLFDA